MMIDKSLLGSVTTILVLAITLIDNNSYAQIVITKSPKKINTRQKISQKISKEPNQINPYLKNTFSKNILLKSAKNTANPENISSEQTYLAQAVRNGKASWYGPGFHGRRTANGEVFNQNALTAAHRSLPFGTRVRVTNVNNGRSVVVRINDRGPFTRGRVIDLSTAAANSLGMIHHGVAPVRLEVLGY